MAENSKIEWTDHTFNPWRGCTKVSPGCDHCYAERDSKRFPKIRGVWGKYGTRVVASDAMWNEPLKWNRKAEAEGIRKRVFCASLADVFEGPETMPEASWEAVRAARGRLFDLIYLTPHLDWLLLTKRPQNVMGAVFHAYDNDTARFGARPMLMNWWRNQIEPSNVWIGTSVEDQNTADERIPELLKIPAKVRFLSMEPLLGPINLRQMKAFEADDFDCLHPYFDSVIPRINWVLVGGESGPNARPLDIEWIRSIAGQCKSADVPVFVKQLGALVEAANADIEFPNHRNWMWSGREDGGGPILRSRKGGDPDEWPEGLRIRQFPCVKH